MKLGFRQRPDDLYLVAGLAVILSVLVPLGVGGIAGFAAGVLVVFVLPGYALVAALFPAAGELDWLRRITLGVGLSLAIVALAGLVSNFAPWGIRVGAIIVILDIVTIGACAFAYVRRRALPPDRRLSLEVEIRPVRWSQLSSIERSLVIGLGVAIVIAAASIAYSASRFTTPPGFTELYLLNESGKALPLPLELVAGENATVLVVVSNHETVDVNYTLEILTAALVQRFNATTGKNETVEVASAGPVTMSVPLPEGSEVRYPYTFHIDQPGQYRVKFFLYRGQPTSDVYLHAELFVRVT